MRKEPLVNGALYHIFTKSISGHKIFRSKNDYTRMKNLLWFYKKEKIPTRFSIFQRMKNKEEFYERYLNDKNDLVEIIAYCLMPTHLHILLRQLRDSGISIYMSNVLNSYTRYFNNKNKRKGPLWQSRFKSVMVKTDEQILHLTRYIHLNPVADGLVDKPEEWLFSSYREYIGAEDEQICNFSKYINVGREEYAEFVKSRIDYQRILSELKVLILE